MWAAVLDKVTQCFTFWVGINNLIEFSNEIVWGEGLKVKMFTLSYRGFEWMHIEGTIAENTDDHSNVYT